MGEVPLEPIPLTHLGVALSAPLTFLLLPPRRFFPFINQRSLQSCHAINQPRKRESVIENQLVPVHFIIVMIRWIGLDRPRAMRV